MTTIKPVQLPQGLRYRHLIHPPSQPIHVAHLSMPKLELTVQAFLAMHRSRRHRQKTPRILLVQGLPGTGKSQGCLSGAKLSNTALAVVPPSIFGSQYEGGAVQQFTELMHTLERYSAETKEHVAALFEDMDASTLSVSENTAHTVNSKEMVGHLQTLADKREIHVCFDGSSIPWLATTNSAVDIRKSAFRDMRAKIFTHEVDQSTKRKLVDLHFDPQSPEEQKILDRLFYTYNDEQPAFWTALLDDYESNRVQSVISATGFDMTRVDAELERRRPPLNLKLLQSLAKVRVASRPRNYLT